MKKFSIRHMGAAVLSAGLVLASLGVSAQRGASSLNGRTAGGSFGSPFNYGIGYNFGGTGSGTVRVGGATIVGGNNGVINSGNLSFGSGYLGSSSLLFGGYNAPNFFSNGNAGSLYGNGVIYGTGGFTGPYATGGQFGNGTIFQGSGGAQIVPGNGGTVVTGGGYVGNSGGYYDPYGYGSIGEQQPDGSFANNGYNNVPLSQVAPGDISVRRVSGSRIRVTWNGDTSVVRRMYIAELDSTRKALYQSEVTSSPASAQFSLSPRARYIGVIVDYIDGTRNTVIQGFAR